MKEKTAGAIACGIFGYLCQRIIYICGLDYNTSFFLGILITLIVAVSTYMLFFRNKEQV